METICVQINDDEVFFAKLGKVFETQGRRFVVMTNFSQELLLYEQKTSEDNWNQSERFEISPGADL